MKKLLKICIGILILTMLFSSVTSICAVLANGFNPNFLDEDIEDNSKYTELADMRNKIIGIVVIVFQVLSFGGLVFCGIKYMFSGASAKAQLKTSLISIMIGCIIVFGASTVIGAIARTARQVIQ